MSKTCSHCNFKNNPDGAHFCGSCGKSLFPSNYRWTVVDMYGYSRVSTAELNRLREIERKYNASPWNRFVAWLKKIDMDDIWAVVGIVGIIVAGIVIAFLFVLLIEGLFKGCSDEKSDPQLQRIEENGKYGVGYDKGHMLVAAQYADISMDAVGQQWITLDGQGKKGLVYVCDSVVNTISPAFSDVQRFSNGASIVSADKMHKSLVYRGEFTDSCIYRNIYAPGTDGQTFILEDNNGKFELLRTSDMTKTNNKYNYGQWADGLIRMRKSGGSDIYSIDGTKLQSDVYNVNVIADSMFWAYESRKDCVRDRPSLYNAKGKLVKKFPAGSHHRNFGDGIGWVRDASNKSKWTAIDRNGNELFTYYGEDVQLFTMGLAPVLRNMSGTNKMGMMDTKGHIVIPFKYTGYYNKMRFDRDSTMAVKLDGVSGRLHRDGTFTPD